MTPSLSFEGKFFIKKVTHKAISKSNYISNVLFLVIVIDYRYITCYTSSVFFSCNIVDFGSIHQTN